MHVEIFHNIAKSFELQRTIKDEFLDKNVINLI